MNVFINNQKREIENQKTLIQLLQDIQMDNARGIAIAINNEVVPKLTWEKHSLQENDRLTIIKATQGG
jgi:sulfur carrier protein